MHTLVVMYTCDFISDAQRNSINTNSSCGIIIFKLYISAHVYVPDNLIKNRKQCINLNIKRDFIYLLVLKPNKVLVIFFAMGKFLVDKNLQWSNINI